MANTIWLREPFDAFPFIRLGNRATDAFLATLVLSGSALAASDSEKDLIVFLAAQDQTYKGDGCVGFGLADMPWHADVFVQQVAFMARAVDGAISEVGWDRVPFVSAAVTYRAELERFKVLLAQLNTGDLSNAPPTAVGGQRQELKLCSKHQALRYPFNGIWHCFICHWEEGRVMACSCAESTQ